MTQAEISNFLAEGALFRDQDGKCYIWNGPLQAQVADAASGRCRFDLGIREFYASSTQLFSAKGQKTQVSQGEIIKELQVFLELNPVRGGFQRQDFTEPSQKDYGQAFADVDQRIKQGRLRKAVPSIFTYATPAKTVSLAQKANWLVHLLRLPSSVYVYGFWQEGNGFVGASPEILFRQSENQIETMALAGTLAKAGHQASELLQDPKERLEHQLVVEDIVQRLQGLGQVVLAETQVLELPTLFHLQTKISLKTPQTRAPSLELLERLHPTSALGVFPHDVDYHFMKTHPGQEGRGIFGGPVFFQLSDQDAICLVAIRNVQWDAAGVRIGTGGGVVESSQFEREWNELNKKREAIFSSLGMI